MKYNGSTYIYRKDVQGNIISLLDSNGRIVVKYAYDAWGNYAAEALDYYDGKVQFKNVDSDKAFNADYEKYKQLANINPFRYNVGASFSLINQTKQKLRFYVCATRMRPLILRKKCPCKQAFFCLFCADIITTPKPNCISSRQDITTLKSVDLSLPTA